MSNCSGHSTKSEDANGAERVLMLKIDLLRNMTVSLDEVLPKSACPFGCFWLEIWAVDFENIVCEIHDH